MDVNNTSYFLFRSEQEFEQGSSRLHWKKQHATCEGSLCLTQNQAIRLPQLNAADALTAWQNTLPLALDKFNQVARLSGDNSAVEFNSGRGFLPLQDDTLTAVFAPAGNILDLHLSNQGELAMPYSNGSDQHGLLLFHLRKRWQTQCSLSFAPLRSWLDNNGNCWSISNQHLMLCQGRPLPLPYATKDHRFEPLTINPNALTQIWAQPLPSGLQALAICGDDENLYVLCHDGSGQQTLLKRVLSDVAEREFTLYRCHESTPFVIDLALLSNGDFAALAPPDTADTQFQKRDCPIIRLRWQPDDESEQSGQGFAELVAERYPMLSLAQPRFVSSADGQVRYQAQVDPDYPEIDPRPRELHPLHQPRYHLEAHALLHHTLDSGQLNTIWHRIYLDAHIPSGCAIRISARVYDTPEQRGSSDIIEQQPPQWMPLESELAFQKSLSGYETNRRGLFEVLLQRPAGPMRRLMGRHLQLQIQFRSNGRQTPSLHAIRVYHPRFSYQEAYLPELYRQEIADASINQGPANGADTRERLLANFEGMLTPIEGRIAASDQLLHPDACPPSNLAWLAQSIGVNLPPHWPEHRQRRLLKNATLIQQYKGTLDGVRLALDIATDKAVEKGQVVLVENFRLRRTMATILGRNMDDAEHPLTLGTGMSGNSIVGNSLILADITAREFLALFAPELASKDEQKAVDSFFELYAHKISVLLHGPGIALRQQVEEALMENMPAHLQWQIIETDRPFVLGTAPLLSVDTFVENRPTAKPVTLNDTWIGKEGVVHNPPAFSPRDINATT